MAINEMKWEVATLRMTAFPSPDAQLMNHDWWMDVVGEPPEQRTEQPRTGERLEQAPYHDGRLILHVQPLRINWVLQVIDDPSLEASKFATLGMFSEELEVFRSLMRKWFDLDTSPALMRLAFGAVLLRPVDTRKNGYEVLKGYLPSVTLDSDHSSDFLYQINRRRSSKTIVDLDINRLIKWSVTRGKVVHLNIGDQARIAEFPDAYACRLELDINTMQEYEELIRGDRVSSVFDELVELGIEVSEKGDIP